MAKKNLNGPHHRTVAQTIWTLVLVIRGEREILGQFSSEAKGMAEVGRIIANDCGMKVLTKMPPWHTVEHRKVLTYGRDAKSWWFELEPWPVDAEAV